MCVQQITVFINDKKLLKNQPSISRCFDIYMREQPQLHVYNYNYNHKTPICWHRGADGRNVSVVWDQTEVLVDFSSVLLPFIAANHTCDEGGHRFISRTCLELVVDALPLTALATSEHVCRCSRRGWRLRQRFINELLLGLLSQFFELWTR